MLSEASFGRDTSTTGQLQNVKKERSRIASLLSDGSMEVGDENIPVSRPLQLILLIAPGIYGSILASKVIARFLFPYLGVKPGADSYPVDEPGKLMKDQLEKQIKRLQSFLTKKAWKMECGTPNHTSTLCTANKTS